MKSLTLVWTLLLLAGAAPSSAIILPAQAEPACPVPEDLALRGLSLPAARHALAADHRLTVLTLGGMQTAGTEAGDRSATYPARLEADLGAALPGVRVSVVNEALPNNATADIPPRIPEWLAASGARLVIWAPGNGEVALRSDPAVFRATIQAGIDAVRAGGVQLILLDAPFVPAPEHMARIEPYRRQIVAAAADNQVPLLPRHDLMRRWNEDRTLNLAARDEAERLTVVRRLFACLARSLAAPIAAAVR